MKRVLVTAGCVYGSLDDNKLVGNRVRGIWATRFAEHLAGRGHPVTLLVPDTFDSKAVARFYDDFEPTEVLYHKGYWDYAEKCCGLAKTHDAAILAAAVVNWIPAEPVKGKMPTAGYNEGDIIDIPFVLAPRVINRMRGANPHLTLVGCKMLIGSEPDELVDAAYHVLLAAKCNVVVANDMGHGLKLKRLVYQDRTVVDYDDDFEGFFAALEAVIEDEHYQTRPATSVFHDDPLEGVHFRSTFDHIVERHRTRFVRRQAGSDRVFGAVAVRAYDLLDPSDHEEYLISPREKGEMFSSADAVTVVNVRDRCVLTHGGKATLNAPLLVRMLWQYRDAVAVLHLHEQLPGVPTVPYAPPGTARDNEREIPGPAFNIEGHGFIACLDNHHQIARR